MKKKTIAKFIVSCLVGTLLFSVSASAGSAGRRENLKSMGNIDAVIDNKKIYISSSDLRYLADEIDSLENTYKTNIVDALNSIGSFFKTDGTVVYDARLNEVDSVKEKAALTFNRLREAIVASQSVVSLSQTQATDRDGKLLYYADKQASDGKNVLRVTTTNTGYPVYYRGATAENLSAGTAAWVNGVLLKGNGTDNGAYYDEGASTAITGTATPAHVLKGYTFSSAQGAGLTGTMENWGQLNWTPDGDTTYTVKPGYYSGGTLDSSGAYNKGVEDGKRIIDPESDNYKEGYEEGVASAFTGMSVMSIDSPDMLVSKTLTLPAGRYEVSYMCRGYSANTYAEVICSYNGIDEISVKSTQKLLHGREVFLLSAPTEVTISAFQKSDNTGMTVATISCCKIPDVN